MLVSRLLAAVATASLVVALGACGGDPAADVVTDPAGSPSASASPTEASTPAPTAPTEAPKPGSLPDFPYPDYAYTLGMSCFCAFYDQKWRITVAGGQVTGVAWATKGQGHAIGDVVPDATYLRLTIQDIIDKGNASGMAKVKVLWPAGQLYPDSVYVDQMANVADEEVAYLISDVEPA